MWWIGNLFGRAFTRRAFTRRAFIGRAGGLRGCTNRGWFGDRDK
ncbi:hypothetical protein LBMAG15_04920 [Actinomycetes bacterium]|nr:hypothetical protein LBMAG15_04920 [Actinomycetes bacterium]